MEKTELLSSKEIIEKTGISRATLNNYIKMGILPRPEIRKGDKEIQGATQLGYFPADVIELISTVKMLKSQGISMAQIVKQFQREDALHEKTPPSPLSVADGEKPDHHKSETGHTRPGRIKSNRYFSVSLGDLDVPAYFINHNFQIDWINEKAEMIVFQQNVSSLMEIESRNLFSLLLHNKIISRVENWREVIATHMKILNSKLNRELIGAIFDGITRNQQEILEDIYNSIPSTKGENFYHLPLNYFFREGDDISYCLHSMKFREGIFIVYIPTDKLHNDILQILTQREKVIKDILKNRMPALVSLCVMVADLQDSVKISAGLLPLEYFELINDLWKTVSPIFIKYGAIFGKHAGDGIINYFIKKPGSNYLLDAVNCALDLRETMKDFNKKWKLCKEWDSDLVLNIGINEGEEFFGTIQSAANIEFTALGDSINYAGRLSDFARNGEIWTTKNLMSKLSNEEIQKLKFGVQYREKKEKTFIRNSFARIGDVMSRDDPHYKHFSTIDALPITQIVDRVAMDTV